MSVENQPTTPEESDELRKRLSQLRHDMMTPLNQVIGFTEMVIEDLEESGSADVCADAQKVLKAANNLVDLVASRLNPDQAQKLGKPAGEAGGNIPPTELRTKEERARDAEKWNARILVVDDIEDNRSLLSLRLGREGHETVEAEDGHVALDLLGKESFDLVLLDIMMPGLNGYDVLKKMKSSDDLKHIPVIMISALSELESVITCIENGAEDYLPKPFNPALLRARINASLEKKWLRDEERRIHAALEISEKKLADELMEAAEYVRKLLPPPSDEGIVAHWRFIPSALLGGDAFGYHWLDEDHFTMFLLDVCGHGVNAALLSISVMNVLRSQTLPSTDFLNPSSVLDGLNESFPMEDQNGMYFTIWYGVFNRRTRQLDYSSGGHPPAVLVSGEAESTPKVDLLMTPGLVIGGMQGVVYRTGSCEVPEGSRLYVYSDGVYEVQRPSGEMMTHEEFVEQLVAPSGDDYKGELDDLISYVRKFQEEDEFEDDFSIVKLTL